jgi:hypothetical protein
MYFTMIATFRCADIQFRGSSLLARIAIVPFHISRFGSNGGCGSGVIKWRQWWQHRSVVDGGGGSKISELVYFTYA